MIKIGFSGVPGCGKTTLVSELKKTMGMKYSTEVSEDISNSSPFDIAKGTSFVSQFYYFTTQINEENKKSINSPDLLLCDKTIFDQLIYWKKYFTKVGENKLLTEKNELMYSLYDFWVKSYDIIFFLRVDDSIMETRDKDYTLRDDKSIDSREMESMYIKTIKKHKLEVVEIWNNKNIDETMIRIAEKISEYMENKDEN